MPQLAEIAVNDGKATPVSHRFQPRDIVSGVATLTEGNGIPLGENQLSFSLVRTAAGRRNIKVKMILPIVQDTVVAGVTRPTLVRNCTINVDFSFSEESSTAERKDARAMIVSALNSPVLSTAINELQALY